ncbi:shikimate kinase [Velocimicrobium porci]|uniref:Shikimate kinase n=1 Tax=Velocimicrobium porci TaxID=2606634 RepID=A0A6L5XWC8_9FIRM|nr:shikimate kinase [Velocimicrobium porci]MSS63136.1 shikimate kinase [Velocimicrobium porci]
MKNIVLIGMPAAGKSTIGVILAKELNYHFIDSDLVIQEREERLLREIIAEEGLDRFIEIENEANRLIEAEKAVIATGGSVIYGKEAMEHFYNTCVIVYLKISYDSIANRIGDPKKRGVVLKENQTLRDLYEERCPLYEKYAHITVETDGLEIGEVMQKIKNSFKNPDIMI